MCRFIHQRVGRDAISDSIKIAVVSDTHLGSPYAEMHQLHRFYKYAEDIGCQEVLHCGDLIDGIKGRPSHMRMFTSPENLIEYVVTDYPDNLPTYWITGNHESQMMLDIGMDIGAEINNARSDLECIGIGDAELDLYDRHFVLYHGWGGLKTYDHIQAGYSRRTCPPDFVLCGHTHTYMNTYIGKAVALAVPSFQATTPFMRQQSVVGGLIITIGRSTEVNLKHWG